MLRRVLLALLLLFGFFGAMTAVEAAGRGTKQAVVADIMTGDAADHRALQATFCRGVTHRERERCGGKQGGDRLHGGSPCRQRAGDVNAT